MGGTRGWGVEHTWPRIQRLAADLRAEITRIPGVLVRTEAGNDAGTSRSPCVGAGGIAPGRRQHMGAPGERGVRRHAEAMALTAAGAVRAIIWPTASGGSGQRACPWRHTCFPDRTMSVVGAHFRVVLGI